MVHCQCSSISLLVVRILIARSSMLSWRLIANRCHWKDQGDSVLILVADDGVEFLDLGKLT